MLKRLLYAFAGLLMMLGVAITVYLGLNLLGEPSIKPGLAVFNSGDQSILPVKSDTFVQEEREYLCGDIHIVFLGRAPRELLGLDREGLARRYPAAEGWSMEEQGRMLILKQRVEDFCPEHKNYRHLGVHEGCLAVFEGPLGYDEKLLRVEKNMPVATLHPDLQLKLHKAGDFNRQDPETQAILRAELEFPSEQAVNAMLENLDEATESGTNPGLDF
ncbi:hypothetical protein [Desulfofundulus thermosubterraneus]|uniref:Bypass of forespore C C-terminal domain-containing protein n=1 Tax=Desulfofundulus thermosubterraneus DSM 16057 TaxID=1121432 RepID=A0A1M6H753_9FIRM|nr:hypothetical protein [Desulfofundulus thermosubterraneus]SHJ17943.1 hypothetical protein SAMN02745219_01920 [Desulfofundulus thermosubterraneus DSM 16057]